MRKDEAILALTALAQDVRLDIFRLLVAEGRDGVSAGEIARRLRVMPSTLSHHLAHLERGGLAVSRRVHRQVFYAVDVAGVRSLIGFLTEDCCGGRPDLCGMAGRGTCETAERPMTDKVFNVLFLCTGNSCRSIMAESILNRLGQGRFMAYSAGSKPSGNVNPHALALLRHLNYPTGDLRSKDWTEFTEPGAPQMDFVFTVCDNAAGESCPVWPGRPMSAHWGVPDPAEATGTEAEIGYIFHDVYRMLERRIDVFCNLPMAAVDRLTLQKRLDAIGARPQ